MTTAKWDENLSVGVREMDDQHKHLLMLAYDLFEVVNQSESTPMLQQAFDDLIQYARIHFSAEEQLMKTHGYRDFHVHQKVHHDLLAQLEEIRQDLCAQGNGLDGKSRQFLKDWLENHIMATDKRYSAFLNANGIQ